MTPAQIVANVASQVLLPLLAGGALRPIPPIGEAHAIGALEHVAFADSMLDEVRARRLRVARRLVASDALGDPSPSEWLLLFALNDILQSTNETLPGPFAANRPKILLEMARRSIERAGAPHTIGEAISRYATFARLLEIVRIDTHVSWWVGGRSFHGARPPARLTAWRKVRRVTEREEVVPLVAMAATTPSGSALFEECLSELVAASPLTDLENAGRSELPFQWTGSTLALLGSPTGRTLALRALERCRSSKSALAAIQKLPDSIAKSDSAEASFAKGAVSELVQTLSRSGSRAASG